MPLMRFFYSFVYRHSKAPWDSGPREMLAHLVSSGEIKPGKAIDLGCGTGSNCIYLAINGFDVTGVDYSAAAIHKARAKADRAGAKVNLVVDDLTNLKKISGKFDFIVDYRTLDDLTPAQRNLYVRNVLPLAEKGTKFLLFAFEWHLARWKRFIYRIGVLGAANLELGEVSVRFGKYFEIKELERETNSRGWPKGSATYLLTRK